VIARHGRDARPQRRKLNFAAISSFARCRFRRSLLPTVPGDANFTVGRSDFCRAMKNFGTPSNVREFDAASGWITHLKEVYRRCGLA
jgi:hypothetical protein